jgi:hypothetical protein
VTCYIEDLLPDAGEFPGLAVYRTMRRLNKSFEGILEEPESFRRRTGKSRVRVLDMLLNFTQKRVSELQNSRPARDHV